MEQSLKILALYDTALGHFKFFRKFLEILLHMNKNIEKIERESADKSKLLEELLEKIDALNEKVAELEDDIKSFHKADRELAPRRTRDIMDDIYNSYNRDDN